MPWVDDLLSFSIYYLTCVTVIFKLVFISKPSKHKNKAKRREHMAQVDFDLTFRSPLAATFSPTTSFLRRQGQNFVRRVLKYFNSLGEQNFAADAIGEKNHG